MKQEYGGGLPEWLAVGRAVAVAQNSNTCRDALEACCQCLRTVWLGDLAKLRAPHAKGYDVSQEQILAAATRRHKCSHEQNYKNELAVSVIRPEPG